MLQHIIWVILWQICWCLVQRYRLCTQEIMERKLKSGLLSSGRVSVGIRISRDKRSIPRRCSFHVHGAFVCFSQLFPDFLYSRLISRLHGISVSPPDNSIKRSSVENSQKPSWTWEYIDWQIDQLAGAAALAVRPVCGSGDNCSDFKGLQHVNRLYNQCCRCTDTQRHN